MQYIFSIVILIHNEEKTIGQLLNNLLKGLSHYNTEILIINSESTDKSLQIIKRMKIPNMQIVHISKKSFNFGSTRNLSVSLARGKYICFISADAKIINTDFLKYFYEDFSKIPRTVAIYGKQIPYLQTPYIQKMEISIRFSSLDKQTKNGIAIQNKYQLNQTDNLMLYFLSNTFACYDRKFLRKNPFLHTMYGEDIYMGKTIIESGFTKVYDSRCRIIHSNKKNIFEYFVQERNEILMKRKLKIPSSNRLLNKISMIFNEQKNYIKKILLFLFLFYYYIIKLLAKISLSFI